MVTKLWTRLRVLMRFTLDQAGQSPGGPERPWVRAPNLNSKVSECLILAKCDIFQPNLCLIKKFEEMEVREEKF